MTRKTSCATKRKRLFMQALKEARGLSSTDLREITRDAKRIDWGGKPIGRTKRQRAPARIIMNQRYHAGKKPVSSFNPGNYSIGELEAIARGRGGEAWSFTMQRSDVPITCQKMALEELERRYMRRR